MSTDAMARLAFSLYQTSGTYAVLLGSGISRAAGIKTGWDIAIDLIPKMALALGDDALENPEEWYKETIWDAGELFENR